MEEGHEKINQIYQELSLNQKFKVLAKTHYLDSFYRVISNGDETLLIREDLDGSIHDLTTNSSFGIQLPKEGSTVQEQNINILNRLQIELTNNKKHYAKLFMGLYANSCWKKFSLENCIKDFESIIKLDFYEFDSKTMDKSNILTTDTSFRLAKESKESFDSGLGFGSTILDEECLFTFESI